MDLQLNVTGMTCANCVQHVAKALHGVVGVDAVTIDLESGVASITGTANSDALRAAVVSAGYATTD